jgi:hypothetical protein
MFKLTWRIAVFAGLMFAPIAARADEPANDGRSGKAAAHAALSDGADLPATPPQLPAQASDQAHQALANTAFGKKGQATSRAHAQAQPHAVDDAGAAHANVANRAAQGSVAAAARGANADGRAAAGQARATTAKANAAGHTTRPITGGRP